MEYINRRVNITDLDGWCCKPFCQSSQRGGPVPIYGKSKFSTKFEKTRVFLFYITGKSFIAHLIEDAGGDYFWEEDTKTGSSAQSFETVYAKAKDCDIWINLYNLNSKKELLSYDERYGLFKACKNNQLYNNNKIQNALGYSNYWETGITNPDEVLADLIAIFSPELLPKHEFVFYKKIE